LSSYLVYANTFAQILYVSALFKIFHGRTRNEYAELAYCT
jgi:hypothetical protein